MTRAEILQTFQESKLRKVYSESDNCVLWQVPGGAVFRINSDNLLVANPPKGTVVFVPLKDVYTEGNKLKFKVKPKPWPGVSANPKKKPVIKGRRCNCPFCNRGSNPRRKNAFVNKTGKKFEVRSGSNYVVVDEADSLSEATEIKRQLHDEYGTLEFYRDELPRKRWKELVEWRRAGHKERLRRPPRN